jgi:hypothetical protein
MRFLYYILFSTLLFSCQDIKKEKQIATINSLLKTIDSIEHEFKKNSNDSIGKIITSVMNVELRIKNNYVSDTIDKAFAKKINAYKMVRKKLKPIGKKYSQITDSCKEEKLSLNTLKKDIENNAGDESKYDEYIKFEANKVKQIKMILDDFITGQNSAISTYYELHDELNDFSMSLISKK